MSNPTNETFGQARQGSVAAIIQILNERLAEIGVRTRAVVADDGMLQVLCEADSAEKLDQQPIVNRVRQILENISPHRINKVNINSRLVKEEQMLWLEEINRDPDNALLWSEAITLKKPFFIKRWIRDRNLKPSGPIFKDITEPEPKEGSLSKKVIGGVSLAVLLLATGWLFRDDLGLLRPNESDSSTVTDATEPNTLTDLPPIPETDPEAQDNAPEAGDRTADITPQTLPPNTPAPPAPPAQSNTPQPNDEPPTSSGATADAFAEAVRIANQAATDGLTAESVAEWLDLATRWQRAADLMAQIPSGSDQYAAAQERVVTYTENSEMALAQAAALQP